MELLSCEVETQMPRNIKNVFLKKDLEFLRKI